MSENNITATNNDFDLEVEVTNILHKISIPANIKGFNYLRTAIMLSVNDVEMVNRITKLLYPAVAKHYQTTASRAERAIRHAIEIAYDRGASKKLMSILSYEIGGDNFRPTNSEFIAAIADYLRLKSKRSGHKSSPSERSD